MELPLFLCLVSAGFPSPADDHLDGALDLNERLIQRPAATFFTTVEGRSMEGAGIFDGDLLLVDRSLTPRDGDVVVAVVYGDMTVKRYRKRGAHVWLEADTVDDDYRLCIELMDPEDSGIWGVVTHAVHAFRDSFR